MRWSASAGLLIASACSQPAPLFQRSACVAAPPVAIVPKPSDRCIGFPEKLGLRPDPAWEIGPAFATADIDNDGNVDLLIPGGVRYGAGDGSFPTSASGRQWETAIAGDFRGDGHHEAIGIRFLSTPPELVIVSGAIATTGPQLASAPAATYDFHDGALATGDFDHDGHLDVAVKTHYDYVQNGFEQQPTIISVFFGNGDATFQPERVIEQTNGLFKGLDAGDVNGDGFAELIVSTIGGGLSDTVAVRFGRTNRTFDPPIITTIAAMMTIADVNGDGRGDLITRDAIAPGNGDGTFGAAIPRVAGRIAVPVVDLDGDGRLDLVVTIGDEELDVELGSGDGTFHSKARYHVRYEGAYSPLLADVNHDGVPDLLSRSSPTGIMFGHHDGTLDGWRIYELGPSESSTIGGFASGDLDGDGLLDLAVGTGVEIHVFAGQPANALMEAHDLQTPHFILRTAMIDLDGDGDLDVVALGGDGATAWLGDGAGGLADAIDTPLPVALDAAIGDLDCDGHPDLVLAKGAQVEIWRGRGDGGFVLAGTIATPSIACVPPPPPTDPNMPPIPFMPRASIELGDFNGDGALDIVVAGCDQGVEMLATGDWFANPVVIAATAPLTIRDLDGDGTRDVISWKMGGPRASQPLVLGTVLYGVPDGTIDAPIPLAFEQPSNVVLSGYGSPPGVVADVDGDRTNDVVQVMHEETSPGVTLDFAAIQFWNQRTATGQLEVPMAYRATASRMEAVALGGDGRPDLIRMALPDLMVYANRCPAIAP